MNRLTVVIAVAASALAQTPDTNNVNSELAPKTQALNAARTALVAASLADPRNDSAIQSRAEEIRTAELALAMARADAAAKDPAAAQAAGGRGGNRGGGGGRGGFNTGGTIPRIREAQVQALLQMANQLLPLTKTLNTARTALTAASVAQPRDDAGMRAKADAVKAAELAIANTRAAALARIQSSPYKLAPDQLARFIALGGSFSGVGFTLPDNTPFSDHEGYVSIFDGVSLKGWDGNPKFWRVEGGALVGESTPQNPSGNSYIVYRGMQAHDFTLKFEIKVEGTGGSGFQYRSKSGIPWLSNISDNVIANTGPVNLNWMLTGPQADFWPSSPNWTGQFYSENTPMRVLAWRGQVVEGAGMSRKQLMGNIGDRQALNSFVKMNDWNEYTVIARGPVCMHIINGQLMAVMVDDDPESSNNQSGYFGIEIEATTKVSTRNIWVKKIN